MSEQRAEQIIVISLFVFMASEIGGHLYNKGKNKKEKQHLTRHIVGGVLTFLLASTVAVAAPEVGAFLAVAVAAHAFFQEGLPTLNKGYKTPEERTTERLPGTTPGPETGLEPLKESSPIALGAAEVLT